MKTSSVKLFTTFTCCFLLILFFNSCEKEQLSSELDSTSIKEVGKKDKAPKTNEGFKAFHQGFEANTNAWSDKDVPGILGWCGTINLEDKKSGMVAPSKGNGYAVIEWGECNYFWSSDPAENPEKAEGVPVFKSSAPATQDPSLWSTSWPANGYIQQLDIYLDAEMFEDGNAFTYVNSIYVPDDENHFRYFAVMVEKVEGDLYVAGEMIPDAGWYTFRNVFRSDSEGNLVADFELWKEREQIMTMPLTQTLYTEELTSSLSTADLGSGYIWFASLQEGVQLPIDEHYLSPANGNAHR